MTAGGASVPAQEIKVKRDDEDTCEAVAATSHPARIELVAFPKLAMPPASALDLEPVPSAMAHFNSTGIPPRFPCVPLATEQPPLSIDRLVLDAYAQALLDDTLRLCAAARVGAPALPPADDGLFDDVAPTEKQQWGFEIFQMLMGEPCAELPVHEEGRAGPIEGGVDAVGDSCSAAEEVGAAQGRRGPEGFITLVGSADLLLPRNPSLVGTGWSPHSLLQGGGDGAQGFPRDAKSTQLQYEHPQNTAGAPPASWVAAAADGSESVASLTAGSRHRGSLGGTKHGKTRSRAAAGRGAQAGEGREDLSRRPSTSPASKGTGIPHPPGREALCLNTSSPGLDGNADARNSAVRQRMRRISEARAWGERAPGSSKTLSPRVGDAGLSKARWPRPVPPPPLDSFLSGAAVSAKPFTHPAPSVPAPEPAYEEMEPRRFTSAPTVYEEPLDVPSLAHLMGPLPPGVSVGLHMVRPTPDGRTPGVVAAECAPEEAAGFEGERTTVFLSLSIPTAVPKSARRGRAR